VYNAHLVYFKSIFPKIFSLDFNEFFRKGFVFLSEPTFSNEKPQEEPGELIRARLNEFLSIDYEGPK